MEKIVKFSKTVRNNWKKSVLGVIALYYGGATVKENMSKINIIMRAACKEAAKFGEAVIPMERNPTLVTVILNPVANKRKAKKDFEKYCEPLLHLAGLQVDVIQTSSEGNAKEMVESLRGTEAIIVAGGDGTLSETVTGPGLIGGREHMGWKMFPHFHGIAMVKIDDLSCSQWDLGYCETGYGVQCIWISCERKRKGLGLLRRNDEANRFPLGILPLGRTNSIGNTLFPTGKGVDKVRQLVDASMAIIQGSTVLKDAMKIEPIVNEDEQPSKPIYAMASLEWGAFRDTLARKDKYWLYGSFREYAAFIFNGYKSSLNWNCSGTIKYTPPCAGCSNCVAKKPEVKTKWGFFMPTTRAAPEPDQTKFLNPECASLHELCFKTCDFKIVTQNIEKKSQLPALNLVLGQNTYSYVDFISEGWNRLNGKEKSNEIIHARTIELLPKETNKEVTIEIDKEDFELKPVRITLLPKVIKLFCLPEVRNH